MYARLWNRVYQLLFLGYTIVLFWELFLGKYRSHSGPRRYNLSPLKTIASYFENYESFGVSIILINLAGNILAFMPMGFLLPLVFKRTGRLIVITRITLLTSIVAEICQYIFNVGGLDIDDVLLNTIGGVLGYLVYRAYESIAYRRSE
ncbi:Teicoplanin resistance protein vanZ [Desulfosporosinus sp. I2]|uniref:VanZ family protein n=1 Tax=Desulfosporosinus sp. I2 TaxID=1617025 RepID=UPI0005F09A80|nr:VanZ family protein [Desulfosporosinus sp. I2]KJR46714.1 Teicoplanin resistance protein vanZ [Desulfosporosinus sp. I2]